MKQQDTQARNRLGNAEALIFDFDGTLAPNLDLPDMRRQVVALTLERGVPQQVFEDLYIVEIIEAAAAWLSRKGGEAAADYHATAHGLITEFELQAAKLTEPFPAARATLNALRQRGKRLGVVTRNCSRAVRTVFGDIDVYCEAVLARDDVEFLKPDVRHVRQALGAMNGTPERAAMIGDGRLDMHVGQALGMTCVGVLTGSADADTLRAAGAHLIVAGLEELL
ncbi:MAG: HAD hydrolase-like protein [Pseudomonadales bacterium]|nr:HAD family hydrolase [Pseudomonadales bacterium]NIX09689.1 HAD hydrolase-like protein [Pseudomonadales bacterium]